MIRKLRWLIVIILLLAAYLLVAHLSGGKFPTPGLALGGDRALIRKISQSFVEDIQFKDFDKAASYHAPDVQETVDIPFLIQRLFLQKPEAIDIMSYEIIYVDIDSTKLRAKVKTRIKAKDLIKAEIGQRELILYFHRKSVSDNWYMELESSLRSLSGEQGKKH